MLTLTQLFGPGQTRETEGSGLLRCDPWQRKAERRQARTPRGSSRNPPPPESRNPVRIHPGPRRDGVRGAVLNSAASRLLVSPEDRGGGILTSRNWDTLVGPTFTVSRTRAGTPGFQMESEARTSASNNSGSCFVYISTETTACSCFQDINGQNR